MGSNDDDSSSKPVTTTIKTTGKKANSTLQITNVPLTATDENLEEFFSEYGPLKRCFVVNPKHPGAKKTLGIVQFAFPDDAEKAFLVRSIAGC